MAKRRSKSKSGSLKSQTIIILAIIIGVIVLLIFRPSIIASILNPLMLILLIVSLLLNAFLAYKLLNKEEKSSESLTIERASTTKNGKPLNSKDLQKQDVEKNLLMKKVWDKDYKIKDLEEKIIELQTTIITLRANQNISDSVSLNITKPQIPTTPIQAEKTAPIAPEPIPTKPAQPKNNSLFFDGPYDDRWFSETNASTEKKHRYVYRIEYATAEPAVGKLHLEPTAEEYDLLRSYSDTVLKPACAFDNAFNTSFHNISQLAPGTVQKQGNDWFVKEKVKIRFN